MTERCAAGDAAPRLNSVERGMQVLRAFRCERTPLSNAELVRRTGLPKATVHRFTTTLVALGYLRQSGPSRKFELDAAPVAFGHACLAQSQLVTRAQPQLQALADRLQLAVGFGLRDDLQILYLSYCLGGKVKTLCKSVGSVVPLALTAVGHACLWGMKPDEREALLPRLGRQAGARADRLDDAMRASFAELDATGSCFVFGLYARDSWGLAAPVRIGPARRLAVLGCSSVDARVDPAIARARVGPALRAAAAQLERLAADLDDGAL